MLPKVKDKVKELKKSLGEPHLLAREFIEYYEGQKLAESVESESGKVEKLIDALAPEAGERNSREDILYKLLKKDLDNYGQLLEHPYVMGELKLFVQHRWHELGFSGGVKFHAALAQPCSELGDSEVCVPNLPDGDEVIVTRSPLVNSNGVILLQNRHIPHLMWLKGSIHINPETAAKHLQADFDGDRLAYDLADKYPTLTEEIREKLLPENRYPDVVKPTKVPYRGTIEEIAIACASDQIGKIANQIMKSVAIQNDTLARPPEKQLELVREAASYYREQLALVQQGKLELPDEYLKPIYQVAKLAYATQVFPPDIALALEKLRTIQKLAVGDLSNQLQVAVDGLKSSGRPDLEVVRSRKLASNVIKVPFLEERKNKEVFNTRPAEATTYSPIDALLREVNQSFEQVNWQSREAHSFRSFHPPSSEEALALAAEIREAYNEKLAIPMAMKRTIEADPEKGKPYALFRSPAGKPIALTRLAHFGSQELLANSPTLSVTLVPNLGKAAIPNTLLVQVSIDGQPRIIGAVSDCDTKGEFLKPSHQYNSAFSLKPAITDARIEAAWRDLDSYAKMLQREHTPQEKKELAAALWHQSHTRDQYGKKKALVAFRLFPDEALAPLAHPQFQHLKLIGVDRVKDKELVEQLKSGAQKTCQMVDEEVTTAKGTRVERGLAVAGVFLGRMGNESPGYPAGTTFTATVQVEPPATVKATLADGTELKIKNVRRYAYNGYEFKDDAARLSLRPAKSPDNNRTGLNPCAFLGERPLGFLDIKSEKIVKDKEIWQGRSTELDATLTSPPPNSATLDVKPDTIVPPWQHQGPSPEPSVESIRARLKTIYDGYADQIRAHAPDLSPGQFDTQVAKRALADGISRRDAASIVSTSPHLTQYRPENSDRQSDDWKRYEQAAKKYIGKVLNAAVPQQRRSMEMAR